MDGNSTILKMKIMKLIAMTDFISQNLNTGCAVSQLQLLHRYKDFLKQPLKLEMFVPCDEDGNILEEPKGFKEWYKWGVSSKLAYSEIVECQKFWNAKEKVLFEGWQYLREDIVYNHSLGIQIYIKNKVIEYIESGGNEVYKCGCVEDLVRFKPILTESLIKQIVIINNE